MRRLTKLTALAAALAGLSIGGASTAAAQHVDESVPYYYDYYDAGFDMTDDGDDWFYDYYEYGPDEPLGDEPYVEYDEEAFEWEEYGLFE